MFAASACARAAAAAAVAILSCAAVPTDAQLRDADLAQVRTVTEGDWLSLRLQVLGLELSYPAYRVVLELGDSSVVHFALWISTPMAKHLQDSGREESSRLLSYHAEGIQNRVADLLRRDFAKLWPRYDGRRDFAGEFMVPAAQPDGPPERWARWKEDALRWD